MNPVEKDGASKRVKTCAGKGTRKAAKLLRNESRSQFSIRGGQFLLALSRLRRCGEEYRRKENKGREVLGFGLPVMKIYGLEVLKNVRCVVLILGVVNLWIFIMAIVVAADSSHVNCSRNIVWASGVVALGGALRLIWMAGMGFTQSVTASTMIAEEDDIARPRSAHDVKLRTERQWWYKCCIWWSRIGMLVTTIQVFGAAYAGYSLTKNISVTNHHYEFCSHDGTTHEQHWLFTLLVILPISGGMTIVAQCCVGSDVLAWRLLYGTHGEAWRAHYQQMFDHGIREVMCCLGRYQYMSVLEKDEVESVAALLGDLVAYRASGASHLEVLAGVALLREERFTPDIESYPQAPYTLLREAALLHPFAVAAYTGPLLDMGRNPLTFPCAWLHRQSVLSPWTRNRRPELEGDNWWRGHAAAFLRHADVPPGALRQGRVQQKKREAVYFVVVLHHLRSVVVAVRGTETPEDLLTDGLGRECALSESDLSGLLKNNKISEQARQEVFDTMPHFGHVGVIEAARELAMELDNLSDISDENSNYEVNLEAGASENSSATRDQQTSISKLHKGVLTSLLGPGGECEGYSLRFVGHSLGGAIAALTGLRFADRYPDLHVYAFGVMPCVDAITAKTCSNFVTSVIYNDEFSSRLSVAAILRLRTAALRALAADANADSALVTKVTRRLLQSVLQAEKQSGNDSDHIQKESCDDSRQQRRRRKYSHALKGSEIEDEEASISLVDQVTEDSLQKLEEENSVVSAVTGSIYTGSSTGEDVQKLSGPAEVFVPGLVIHIVRTAEDSGWSSLKRFFGKGPKSDHEHRAILKAPKDFRDIVVSPAMFLDHMPWKCQYALNDVVEQMKSSQRVHSVSASIV